MENEPTDPETNCCSVAKMLNELAGHDFLNMLLERFVDLLVRVNLGVERL